MIGTSHNFTTDSFYNDMTIQSPSTFQILHIVIQVILFCVGLYFQVRTVLVCIEEKNKTWQIHIAHSIAMTIYFCYIICVLSILLIGSGGTIRSRIHLGTLEYFPVVSTSTAAGK